MNYLLIIALYGTAPLKDQMGTHTRARHASVNGFDTESTRFLGKTNCYKRLLKFQVPTHNWN